MLRPIGWRSSKWCRPWLVARADCRDVSGVPQDPPLVDEAVGRARLGRARAIAHPGKQVPGLRAARRPAPASVVSDAEKKKLAEVLARAAFERKNPHPDLRIWRRPNRREGSHGQVSHSRLAYQPDDGADTNRPLVSAVTFRMATMLAVLLVTGRGSGLLLASHYGLCAVSVGADGGCHSHGSWKSHSVRRDGTEIPDQRQGQSVLANGGLSALEPTTQHPAALRCPRQARQHCRSGACPTDAQGSAAPPDRAHAARGWREAMRREMDLLIDWYNEQRPEHDAGRPDAGRGTSSGPRRIVARGLSPGSPGRVGLRVLCRTRSWLARQTLDSTWMSSTCTGTRICQSSDCAARRDSYEGGPQDRRHGRVWVLAVANPPSCPRLPKNVITLLRAADVHGFSLSAISYLPSANLQRKLGGSYSGRSSS
jgi:hypothetical protein